MKTLRFTFIGLKGIQEKKPIKMNHIDSCKNETYSEPILIMNDNRFKQTLTPFQYTKTNKRW